MINVEHGQFGSLLAHFFADEKALLSPAAAAAISGFGVKTALGALELLESEGILRSSRLGRRRIFSADPGSRFYRRCRLAYAVRQRR